ncbi:similar to Saccharomyces cerevisiae YML103C NUP188 Subunit of the nuclear pore complex (NPC) [Maudiozyma saulgeensis]|uniref:Nucleoporin NUP188 n=1 Tax=Maudiozyma saulgeensis TaxID=1789683 RepID=A0A1X7R4U2_9SACH|nr:similar to Saccharomyces cerevisiae YML103C NUP188 Subunit of the nuclear pore complex (NPC) [Kazachstania saulgeensis]
MMPIANKNNDDVLTSFVNVENFIRTYAKEGTDGTSTYGFTTIDQFIDRNFELLLDSQKFNTIDSGLTNPNTNDKLTLRGTNYKTCKENNETAFHISKLFNLNYPESIRVLSQMTDSWDYNNSASLETLTECVLKERNSTINVVSLLFNDNNLPVLENKYFDKLTDSKTKLSIVKNLIKSIEFVLTTFNVNDNVSTKVSEFKLSNAEFNDLLKMKNSYDLIYLTNILKLLSNLILNTLVPVEIVKSWFTVSIDMVSFLKNNLASIIINIPMNIITKIESLVSINSLLILGLDTTISSINIDAPYFNDPVCFTEVQGIIDDLPTDPILSYMWSFVLYTKAFLIEEDTTKHAAFLDQFLKLSQINISLEDLSVLYAQRAESHNVLEAMIKLTDSLGTDYLYPTIMSSFLTFQLNFIPITVEVSNVIKRILLNTPREFVEKFLTSEIFDRRLSVILAKLPLVDEALIPLINICSSNIEFANFHLHELNTYATSLDLSKVEYDIVDEELTEEENNKLSTPNNVPNMTEMIRLNKDVMVQPPLETDKNTLMPIPKDTRAKILQTGSSTDDNILVFLYDYNGWSTIGYAFQKLCEIYTQRNEQMNDKYHGMIVSIIELLSNVVSTEVPINMSSSILADMSCAIDHESVILLVFKIFEAAIRNRDNNMACICCDFANALVPNYPQYVWQYLARSDLLDRYGKTGLASTILGILELSNGTYRFTIALSKLTNLLVEESLLLGTNMPSKTKEDILNKLITYFLNIYESYHFWKFEDIYERFELGSQLTKLFMNVLYNIYSIDPQSPPEKKVTHMLAKSGKLLLNGFLGVQSSESNCASSLIKILTSYTDKQVYALGNLVFGPVYNDLVIASFDLSILLVSLRNSLHMKMSSLEQLIFTNSSQLVDIFCLSRSLKRPIINLLNTVVSISWIGENPLILSYLGETHAKIFVHVIEADLENPLDDFKLSNDIYEFLGALLESRQHGLSILFLTGDIATSNNIDGDEPTNKGNGGNKSILTVLQNNALKLDLLPDYVSCALLDAIAFAFNSWVHKKSIKNDVAFIDTLMKIFKQFKPSNDLFDDMTNDKILEISNKFRLASRIAEIFALYVYSSDNTLSSSIHQLLGSDDLFSVIKPYFEIQNEYIDFLENIDKEFNKKFPNLSLSRFRLEPLIKPQSHHNCDMFNLDLISTLFIGKTNAIELNEKVSLIEDIKNVSLRLQYANHQIAAAKAWGALLTSYIKGSAGQLKDTYIDIICYFLQTNIDEERTRGLLADVFQERMELCFYILYSFRKYKKSIPEKKLIKIFNELIIIFKSSSISYLKNVSSSTNRELYRPILRSVLIIFDLVKNNEQFVDLASDSILEFFEWSFSKGVYLILSNILADMTNTTTLSESAVICDMDERIQDIFLLLSIFNKIKQLNPPSSFNIVLASSLDDVGTIKVILNLYSSFPSIRLNVEPLLGNLILTLVSELCSVKEISSKFITNGLFAVLLESSLSVILQEGNIKPSTQPRLHNIWSNGLLCIMLLLLSEFGGSILPETCLFASYFHKQIQSTIYSWSDNDLVVSTALIRETTQLILLQRMLEKLNYQGYLLNSNVPNIDDKKFNDFNENENGQIAHLMIGLDSMEEKKALNMTLNKLLTHPKYLNSRIIASTQEEQHMLDDETKRSGLVSHINSSIKDLQRSLFEVL